MQTKFSKREFDFVPQTFVLPGEFEALRHEFESRGNKARWIMKPPASARGNPFGSIYTTLVNTSIRGPSKYVRIIRNSY